MKAFRSIFVLMAMIFAWQLNAAELTSGKVTFISPDGEMSIDLPKSGFAVADYTSYGAAPTLIVKSFEVNSTGIVNDATLVASLYKKGKTPEDHWMRFPLTNAGNGKWKVDINVDLVEAAGEAGEYVLEMYVEANSESGTIYMHNNGSNYKVMFRTAGEDTEKVHWLTTGTADVIIYTGEDYLEYRYDGDGSRNNTTMPGGVDQLAINFYSIYYDLAEGTDIKSASMQYVIIPEGQSQGNWNTIEANELNTLVSQRHNTHKSTFNEQRLITRDLAPGNYQLRIMFQLIDNEGKYYFFGKDNDNFVFNFSMNEPKDPDILGISMSVTPTPGEQEYGWFEKGVHFDATDISDEVALESLTIDEIFIFVQGNFNYVNLAYKFIESNNELFRNDIYTRLDDFGNWSTDESTELLDDRLEKGKVYTLEFWAEGQGSDKNMHVLDNDGENYCVTFKYGSEGGLRGDCNGDGEVDVKDVTALISYILGTTPLDFVIENANVNGDPDGNIDVQDVTALINLILQ